MEQCGAWNTMCEADPTLWVCKNYTGAAAVTAAAGPLDGNATAASSARSDAGFAAPTVVAFLLTLLALVIYA
jgi:hypothetical protein